MKSEPRRFFEAALKYFHLAERTGPSTQADYNFADLTGRMKIAGPELAKRIQPAISHVERLPHTSPDLVVYAWEGAMPSPPWREEAFGPAGEIDGYNNEGFRTVFHVGTGTLSMLDCEQSRALFWIRDARFLPDHERSAPLRLILSWSLESKERLFIHAGAVANQSGAVLLLGPGGAGKSTTALLCLQDGWKYIADDYCAIDLAREPHVFSLYNSAKISQNWLNNVPQLKSLLPANSLMHGDKHIYFLEQTVGPRLVTSAAIRLLLLVHRGERADTTVEPASPAEALRAVGPSTIFQTSASGAMFQHLAELVQRLPIRRLNLGADLEQIPLRIQQCLTSLA